MQLNDSVQYLKGVGEKRAKLYEKLGIHTVGDLIEFFPRAYLDYTDTRPIRDCAVGEVCCVRASVYKKQGEQRIRKGLSIFKVFATDGESDLMITIFNSKYQFEALELGKEYCFYGKMQGNLLRREMTSPSFLDPQRENGIKSIYHLTEGLTSKMISGNMRQALSVWGDRLSDFLPSELKEKEALCHLRYAYENIHFPENMHGLEVARKRLIFDELLTLQLGLLLLKGRNKDCTAVRVKDVSITPFEEGLPFVLTASQKQAIADGLSDFQKDIPMNRLIQGDVGSGKTMVACALAYCMARNGYQTAVMAPTEILAQQHYQTFSRILSPFGISCVLLTGSLTAKQKRECREEIASGQTDVVIGTHAIIQDGVEIPKLGLVVTDEQHRFGVNQRAKLAEKGENPHKLVMSATPIPRTLALIIYGDLDVSVMKESPKGRKPIKTYLIDSPKRLRAYHFIKEHIDKGYQAYIVCPLIEEGEEGASGELHAVNSYAASLKKTELGAVRVGILHGKMRPAQKEEVMGRFARHELDLLICTTVVEVGVDVPNAVIMMIENAENFGLSQLHQLRGRVGRGEVQSHCILVSDHKNEQTRQRLKIMTKSSDGFYISEQDLKQRGPGDFFGERQHGLPMLKVANMAQDMSVLVHTQQIAKELLEEDPTLSEETHKGLSQQVQKLFDRTASGN